MDWDRFSRIRPRILDLVLNGADPETVAVLRLADRAIRDYVDSRIAEHIVFEVHPRRVYTRIGRIALPFGRREIAARARKLDLHAGDRAARRTFTEFEPVIQFPNVEYLRTFDEPCESLLGSLVPCAPAISTTIVPVLKTELLGPRRIGHRNAAASRVITVLPRNVSQLEVAEVDWLFHYPLASEPAPIVQLVVLFAPTPPRPADGQFLECYSDRAFFADLACVLTEPNVHCTVVGLGSKSPEFGTYKSLKSWMKGALKGEESAVHAKATFGDKLRLMSVPEWRGGISAEEWELIESLPGCCW